MAAKLETDQLDQALADLQGWTLDETRSRIQKTFQFDDFNAAFGWMSRIALLAEKMDHHPDWSNVYKTVNVTLATHDAGGLTELDIRMAKAMDRFAASS